MSQSQDQPSGYDQGLITRLEAVAGNSPSGRFTVKELSRWIDQAERSRASWQRWYYGAEALLPSWLRRLPR